MRKTAFAAIVFALPLTATAAPESYTFDPIESVPHFAVDHLGLSTLYGRFNRMSGKFTIDREAKTGSLEIIVEAASVDTADSERGGRPRTRDEHLRSADFFNVAEFPRVTYKASSAKFNGDSVVEIDGQLMLLGVTKQVTFKLERWKCGLNPFIKKEMCGGNAVATIKRSDFGMKYGIPAIGDGIRLMIGFEAYKD